MRWGLVNITNPIIQKQLACGWVKGPFGIHYLGGNEFNTRQWTQKVNKFYYLYTFHMWYFYIIHQLQLTDL